MCIVLADNRLRLSTILGAGVLPGSSARAGEMLQKNTKMVFFFDTRLSLLILSAISEPIKLA
jgi:hypothetical protein